MVIWALYPLMIYIRKSMCTFEKTSFQLGDKLFRKIGFLAEMRLYENMGLW